MKRILFSAVGTTDPVANYKDGSMLHICRFYKPDLIYLYLSKEMNDFHEKDNRFVYAIEDLGKRLGHRFEIKLIIRKDLVDVQKFDFFIEEYTELLKEIQKEANGAELLLNVSSGTPAMKAALQTIAVLQKYPMKLIQVSTPQNGHNPHAEDKVNDDYIGYCKENEDNKDELLKNRCSISDNMNLINKIQNEMLIKLVQEYDYIGANVLAATMSSTSKKVNDLLTGACARLKLDYRTTNRLYKKYGYSILPVEESDKVSVVEYMLWLDLKLKKEEYADFLRGSTPAILDIFERVLKKQCNIHVNDYTKVDGKGIRKWHFEVPREDYEIFSILNKRFPGGIKNKDIYSSHLQEICEQKLTDKTLKEKIAKVRDFERIARNEASHKMVAVTEKLIREKTNMTPSKMFADLKYILGFTDIQMEKTLWLSNNSTEGSYNKMNEILINAIRGVEKE